MVAEKRSPHRWKKGESGNPRGAPRKGKALSEILREIVSESREDGTTLAADLSQALLQLTRNPDPEVALAALKYVFDRLDGKPTEMQQISGPGGGPVELQVVERIVTKRNAGD